MKNEKAEKKSLVGDRVNEPRGKNKPERLYAPGMNGANVGMNTPGINNPAIAPPAFNPPVPNRAWTAMRAGMDIDELSEQERRELYYGKDNSF